MGFGARTTPTRARRLGVVSPVPSELQVQLDPKEPLPNYTATLRVRGVLAPPTSHGDVRRCVPRVQRAVAGLGLRSLHSALPHVKSTAENALVAVLIVAFFSALSALYNAWVLA